MSLSHVPGSKEICNFVEKHIDEISIVEEIVNFPEFELLNYDQIEQKQIDQLYFVMTNLRKAAQTKINASNSCYDECEAINYKYFEKHDSFDNSVLNYWNNLSLVELVHQYLLYRHTILSLENERSSKCKTANFDAETFDIIGTSLCFYCDHPVEPNVMDCSLCGADFNDMTDYANVCRQNTGQCRNLSSCSFSINRKSIIQEEAIDSSMTSEDETATVHKDGEFQKLTRDLCRKTLTCVADNQWQCSNCQYANNSDLVTCDNCRYSLVEDYVVVDSPTSKTSISGNIDMIVRGFERNLETNEDCFIESRRSTNIVIDNS